MAVNAITDGEESLEACAIWASIYESPLQRCEGDADRDAMHRIPLWVFGPGLFVGAIFDEGGEYRPGLLIVGLVLTLVFTVPYAITFWRDFRP